MGLESSIVHELALASIVHGKDILWGSDAFRELRAKYTQFKMLREQALHDKSGLINAVLEMQTGPRMNKTLVGIYDDAILHIVSTPYRWYRRAAAGFDHAKKAIVLAYDIARYMMAKTPEFIRVHVSEAINGHFDITVKFMDMGRCIKQTAYKIGNDVRDALPDAVYFLRSNGYPIGII